MSLRRRPALGSLLALFVVGVLPGDPSGAEAACVPVPFENDRCPEWTAVYDNPVTGSVIGSSRAAAIAVALDGSRVFVAGASRRDATGRAMTTIAYDDSGVQRWEARYQRPGPGEEVATAVAVSPDGATVLTVGAGDRTEDGTSLATVVAYDAATGQQRWVATHGGQAPGPGEARAVAVSPDGASAYVAAASPGLQGDTDVLVVAHDVATGEEKWSHRHAGAAGADDAPEAIAVAPDGERLYVAATEGTGPDTSVYLTLAYDLTEPEPPVEPEPPGEPMWVATYAGPAQGSDTAAGIGLSEDAGSVFVTGTSDDGDTGTDWATVAYDADTGSERWATRLSAGGQDRATGLAVAGDRVVVTGKTVGDVVRHAGVFLAQPGPVTVAYDPSDGTEIWRNARVDAASVAQESLAVVASSDGRRVYVTDRYATASGAGGCSVENVLVCAHDPGTLRLTALAADLGHREWTARLVGTANVHRLAAVPVATVGSRIYVAATWLRVAALRSTEGANNLTELRTMAYHQPTDDPRNTACSIEPFNPLDASRGAGFGTPQVRVQGVVTRASDNGSFIAECQNHSATEPYVITVRYGFEVSPEPDVWEPVGSPHTCSAHSMRAGQFGLATVVVPGTAGCKEPRIFFDEDDPVLGLPHRMCISVLRISGCTSPWTHDKVG